jgi:hypothetical protein
MQALGNCRWISKISFAQSTSEPGIDRSEFKVNHGLDDARRSTGYQYVFFGFVLVHYESVLKVLTNGNFRKYNQR